VLAADPTETYLSPVEEEPVPHFNFAPLQNAVDALQTESGAYDRMLASAYETGLTPAQAEAINAHVMGVEQLLTDERGLPKRPWFRHQIYAPGYYTGYGVKTLPGVREAIEQREFDIVEEQIRRVADAIDRVQAELAAAQRVLGRPVS
jgi:N-acetylated-alpha-linked acidic dipeptidase